MNTHALSTWKWLADHPATYAILLMCGVVTACAILVYRRGLAGALNGRGLLIESAKWFCLDTGATKNVTKELQEKVVDGVLRIHAHESDPLLGDICVGHAKTLEVAYRAQVTAQHNEWLEIPGPTPKSVSVAIDRSAEKVTLTIRDSVIAQISRRRRRKDEPTMSVLKNDGQRMAAGTDAAAGPGIRVAEPTQEAREAAAFRALRDNHWHLGSPGRSKAQLWEVYLRFLAWDQDGTQKTQTVATGVTALEAVEAAMRRCMEEKLDAVVNAALDATVELVTDPEFKPNAANGGAGKARRQGEVPAVRR